MKNVLVTVLPFFALICCSNIHAATVMVKGNVIQPTCSINNGGNIDVPFGDDVLISKIDGSVYKQQRLNYSITCDGNISPQSMLNISIAGQGSSFGNGLLVTSKNGLAVKFTYNSTTLALNTGIVSYGYSTGQEPVIYAVLVKDSANPPEAGYFDATALMQVNYQ